MKHMGVCGVLTPSVKPLYKTGLPSGQGPEKAEAVFFLSRCVRSCLPLVCRQTEEPLPAEAARPTREPPQRRGDSHCLKAQGRQVSRHPVGAGGGNGGVLSPPRVRAGCIPVQVCVRNRCPVPLHVQCRQKRRPYTRSPQSRRPSMRSPQWWVLCSRARAARACSLRQPPQPHLRGSLPVGFV